MNKARKVKPSGRDFWVIEFRHPLLKDKQGKYGRKVRRGLGTSNEAEADQYVEQMNTLLEDNSYWQPSAKMIAVGKFHPGIINAFYDEIEYLISDDETTRNEIIKLKTPEDGYSRVLLLGSTGAGKTTLLRQLMGTNPMTEKFPATSTARTTVFDTEIILAEGLYESVVTFFSEGEARQMVLDSIQNAMVEHFNRNDDSHTLRVFLEDKDQRFRLSYLIGKIKERKVQAFDFIEEDDIEEDDIVSDSEQDIIEAQIIEYLGRIKAITEGIVNRDRENYKSNAPLSEDYKNLLEEIILTDILDYDGDDLAALADEILEQIRRRFNGIDKSGLVTEKFGWPKYWRYESADRADFIKALRFFSSNSANLFGKLVTPLVSGMRIKGPFKPYGATSIPKLVIYDGEGLGHIPNTTSNLPSKSIKKFESSDSIVLVDNCQSPMLASAYAVIRSVAISGHAQKLTLCFTHFDAVKGDNLPRVEDKRNHIFGAVDGLLAKLETELDYEVKKYFLKHLHNSTFYLGYLDEVFDSNNKFRFAIHQLTSLVKHIESLPLKNSPLSLNYDISTLIFRIRKAAIQFHDKWDTHLFGNGRGRKQHFTRIKALARRLADDRQMEYNELRPISDFWGDFNGHLSNFLASPILKSQEMINDENIQQSINALKQKIGGKIFDYGLQTIKNERIADWQNAYGFSGLGSSQERANKISSIYDTAVPIPGDEITIKSRVFLSDIMTIVKESIEESGGQVTSIFNS